MDNIGLSYLEVQGHTFTAALDLEAVTIKYIFADRETQQYNDGSDLDGGAYLARDLFYGGGMAVPTPGFHASIAQGYVEMTTHELQLFGELMGGRLNYTLGYYNYEEAVYQDNPQTFGLPIAFLAADPNLGAAYFGAGFCNLEPGGRSRLRRLAAAAAAVALSRRGPPTSTALSTSFTARIPSHGPSMGNSPMR